jgi:hypothetical protein
MAFYSGSGENKLAVVVDVRSKNCEETDTVLDHWGFGKRALGRVEWNRTLKVALREHGSEPWDSRKVKAAKNDIIHRLRMRGIRCVVPVQSPAQAGIRQVHSSWNMFGHSGSPYKWAGTVQPNEPFAVSPILHPANYEFVYGWLLERWMRQAWALARDKIRPMPWPELCYMPGQRMVDKLAWVFLSKDPIAIDIETNMAGTIITAIGLSCAHVTVSVPWDEFPISGTYGEREPGIESYPDGHKIKDMVVRILEDESIKKILHNGAFDVVQLGKHGITMRGFEHDTLLMHRVVYPQYRHGLQQACATEFCVEPWKCLFKLPKVGKDDDPWLGCPVELRKYNCKDAYATWQLWRHLTPKLG